MAFTPRAEPVSAFLTCDKAPSLPRVRQCVTRTIQSHGAMPFWGMRPQRHLSRCSQLSRTTVFGMKMGWSMVIPEHGNHDSKESTDHWHNINLSGIDLTFHLTCRRGFCLSSTGDGCVARPSITFISLNWKLTRRKTGPLFQ